MLRIAGLQMEVTSDISANRDRILAGLDHAADKRADIVLTPEGSLSGYTANFEQSELNAALDRVTGNAKALGIGVALGTCFYEADGRCYNQVRVYRADGQYEGFASKTMLCSPLDAPGTGELATYASSPLRTFRLKGIVFGCLICSDLWATPGYNVTPNPYVPWQLHRQGARFLLHAVNSGGDQRYRAFHESSLQLWAYALKLPIATVNASPPSGAPNCRSGLVGPDGEWQVSLEHPGEACYVAGVRADPV